MNDTTTNSKEDEAELNRASGSVQRLVRPLGGLTDETECTECGKSSFITYSNWSGPSGQIIGEDEILCPSCARKRKVSMF